jgi:hypothetical protein
MEETMRRAIILLAVLMGVSLSSNVLSATYDATGIWTYTEHSPWNDCSVQYQPESGSVILIQTSDTSFIIVGDDLSKIGTINGAQYTFTDTWCEDYGYVDETVSITLSSASSGSGTVSWIYHEGGYSCPGGHSLSLSKQSQTTPTYDATGTWDFAQSGFWTGCGSSTPPRDTGYFTVIQTLNKISAQDDQSDSYSGFVSGATYYVVRSYLEDGGRTSVVYTITLTSNTEGSGEVNFVWDDDCEECNGGWNISIKKRTVEEPKAMPWIPLLLLDD